MNKNMTARLRAVVQLVAAFGDQAPALNGIADVLTAHHVTLAEASFLGQDELAGRLLVSPEQARRFVAAAATADRVAGKLASPYLSVIARGDAAWPVRGDCPPASGMMPWLLVLGDVSLLSAPAVAFGGSRQATSRSLEITADLVRELVRHERVIVSGGAHGVDAAAHRTALAHGGRTIVVLAQGLGTFPVPAHWWPLIEQGQLAVVSEFSPVAGWEAHQALQRNGTMARLGDGFVVIQAEPMSGTLSAGRSALRLRRPLHVVVQSDAGAESFAGNEQLLAGGGLPLLASGDVSWVASAIDSVLGTRPKTVTLPDQMRLL